MLDQVLISYLFVLICIIIGLSINHIVSFLELLFLGNGTQHGQMIQEMFLASSTQNDGVIYTFDKLQFIIVLMIKIEQSQCEEIEVIKHLMHTIKLKCIGFGFNAEEVKAKIIGIIGNALKIKTENVQRRVIAKLRSKKLDKKKIKKIICELDILKNSLYDNYESQSQNINVKLQNVGQISKKSQEFNEILIQNKAESMPMFSYKLNFKKKYDSFPQCQPGNEGVKKLIVERRLSQMRVFI